MKQSARLIIPLWGTVYAEKLTSLTLPALLAPGNLPALCEKFDVEIMLVTQRELFEPIRQAKSYQQAVQHCPVNFMPLDDLMTREPGAYGVVLTKALYRGFSDLGPKVTETFLLFLNADFVIADGSYRHLAQLMLAGKRLIHAPSFRVVLEDVWPLLRGRVEAADGMLALAPREMVRLALDHKHLTVKGRTINQQFYHQWCMDQFYWYVDESTLIGYQFPIALVAIKPERVIPDPVLVWDFGYIPEAAPTLEPHFITDSDNFFMLEPQKRSTGEELMRPGPVSHTNAAKFLADYTTFEQRRCGQQLLTIHSAQLPFELAEVADASRTYLAEVMERLPATSQSHTRHQKLGRWFIETVERIKNEQTAHPPTTTQNSPIYPSFAQRAHRTLVKAARDIHTALFGKAPEFRSCHPLWSQTNYALKRLRSWQREGLQTVRIGSRDDSLFRVQLNDRLDLSELMAGSAGQRASGSAKFESCLCELSPGEFSCLPAIHDKIRSMMRNRGRILYVVNAGPIALGLGHFGVYDQGFPSVDIAGPRFFGNAMSFRLCQIYRKAAFSFPNSVIARTATVAFVLFVLAPFSWLANWWMTRRDSSRFTPNWTTAVLEFEVRKGVSVT